MEFLKRKHLRREERDPEVSDKVSPARLQRWTSGACSKRVVRLSEDDHAADARRERQ